MTDTTTNHQDLSMDDVCTKQTLAKENKELFTDTQVGWMIKTRHKNGLQESGAILKISNRLYIIKPKFFDWFLQQKAA